MPTNLFNFKGLACQKGSIYDICLLYMQSLIDSYLHISNNWSQHPLMATLTYFGLAIIVGLIINNIILKLVLYPMIKRTRFKWDDSFIEHNVFAPFSFLIPILIFSLKLQHLGLPSVFINSLYAINTILVIIVVNRALLALFHLYNKTPFATSYPLHRSYLTIIRMLFTFLGIIVSIAMLVGQSPWGIVTSVGAFTTVLMFIFKDTLLSFVSSIVINTHDLFKEGDWIQVPSLGIDGDVTYVGLHIIKVQQWDKTIISIPTYKLMETSLTNWKGIEQAKGRRIKRSIFIDQNSIHPLSENQIERLSKVKVLQSYLKAKEVEIKTFNEKIGLSESHLNLRRLTNIGTLRAYIDHYLRNHPDINQTLTIMVRQLPPTELGLPLELYCFTKSTQWIEFERVQSDIFDHLLSILDEFDLKVFQAPSGRDFSKLI